MSIEFPDLSSSSIAGLTACGVVSTKDAKLKAWLNEDRHEVAQYKKGGEVHFVRLVTGAYKTNHFHLEVARKFMFPSNKQPVSTKKITEFKELTNKVLGAKMDISARADFVVKFEDLPKNGVIRLLSSKTEVAGMSIKLKSGTLDVSGSRIKEVSWQRQEEAVFISLKQDLNDIADEAYLLDLQATMDRFFRGLVLHQPELTPDQ